MIDSLEEIYNISIPAFQFWKDTGISCIYVSIRALQIVGVLWDWWQAPDQSLIATVVCFVYISTKFLWTIAGA